MVEFLSAFIVFGVFVFLFQIIFKKKSKGCLHGKTQEEKESFFQSLDNFIGKDNMFFNEQYWDMKESERDEFLAWKKANNNMD